MGKAKQWQFVVTAMGCIGWQQAKMVLHHLWSSRWVQQRGAVDAVVPGIVVT